MTYNAMTEKQEEQMVHLVRNALLVASQEMGDGDHWPVVKSTVYSIMKDFENVKVERNLHEEVRKNYVQMIKELEDLYLESPAEVRSEIRAAIVDFQELYYAAFAPIDQEEVFLAREDFPPHAIRAEAIIKTLEEKENA